MFRWFILAVLASALAISATFRWRARRDGGTIPRRQEGPAFLLLRLAASLPTLGAIVAYVLNPGWMAWASIPLPGTVRWGGVLLGVLSVPAVFWVMVSIGRNISETVLTKRDHALVTTGPYRWVRHPLYATGIALLVAIGLMAANTFILGMALLVLVLVGLAVVPREERALQERFGDAYRHYMTQTGRFLPRSFHGFVGLLLLVPHGLARPAASPPPAHYVYFGLERERIREPAFLEHPGISGAQLKYTWRELEPEPDRYVLAGILSDLAFLERHGKRLWIQLQDVSFEEAIVNVPDYLRRDTAFSGGVARQYSFDETEGIAVPEGWVARRWDPAVRDRFIRLLSVLADSLDGRIEGLNLAETSVGFGRSAATRPEGYSPQAYRDGITALMTGARAAFRRSHVMVYANFMPGESRPEDDRGYLAAIFAHAERIGVGVGNPDLLPLRWYQRQHSYPLIAARGPGVVAGVAVQWGNLADRHRRTGEGVTVELLYRYAVDELRLDYLFWGTQEPYYTRDILPFLRRGASRAP